MEEQQKGRSSKKTKKKKKGTQVQSITQTSCLPFVQPHGIKMKIYRVNTDVGRKNVLKFMKAECKTF